jgi:Ser/Thr protein kinase RdoA (MazF antagonist)
VTSTGADLSRIAHSALHAWDIPDGATLRLLKYRENAVFEVSIAGTPTFILRVHRRGYHTDEALRSELTWIRALAEAQVPTPHVVMTEQGGFLTRVPATDGGAAYQCDLLSWVAGVPLGHIESQTFGQKEFVQRAYDQVGRLAARLHLHSRSWRPSEPLVRHSWDEDGCLGENATWGHYSGLHTLTRAERSLLHGASEVARSRLADYGKSPSRFGLIHSDLVPENLLLDGDACTVIDFDDAGFGWFMSDIANAVFFQADTPSFAPALRAMIRGYTHLQPLSGVELRMLDVMLFLRGAAVLGWIATRAETKTAAQISASVTSIALALARHLVREAVYPAALKTNLELLRSLAD